MDARTDGALPLKIPVTINISATDGGGSFGGDVFLIRPSPTNVILSIVFDGTLISVPLTDEQARQLGRGLHQSIP